MRDEQKQFFKELGERITDERKKKKMSSEALAYAMGISKGNLSEIERGMRDLRLGTLKQVAEGLNTSLSKLLKDL